MAICPDIPRDDTHIVACFHPDVKYEIINIYCTFSINHSGSLVALLIALSHPTLSGISKRFTSTYSFAKIVVPKDGGT